MSIITISREDYIRRYESLETKLVVIKALKHWDKFLLSKNLIESQLFESLKRDAGNQKYILLDQLVRFPCSLTWFTYVKGWIKYNDINLDNDKIKDFVRWPKKIREREKGIDKKIVQDVVKAMKPYYQRVVLVSAVSGMRIRSELLNMEWSWIDFETDPVKVTIPARFTKMKQERITFLTKEAADAIRAMPRISNKVFPNTYDAMYKHFSRIRTKLGLTEKKMNGLFQFKPHRFRGFAENKLSKEIGEEFAHAIIGHGAYLGQYFSGGTTDDEAGQDYKKAESALSIIDINTQLKPLSNNEPHHTGDISKSIRLFTKPKATPDTAIRVSEPRSVQVAQGSQT